MTRNSTSANSTINTNTNTTAKIRQNQMDIITKTQRAQKKYPPKSDRELRSHKRGTTLTPNLLQTHPGLSTVESIYSNLKSSPAETGRGSVDRLTHIQDFIDLLTEPELALLREELDRRQNRPTAPSSPPPLFIPKELLSIIVERMMRSNSNGWKQYLHFIQAAGIRFKSLEETLFLAYRRSYHHHQSTNASLLQTPISSFLERHLQTRRAWNGMIDYRPHHLHHHHHLLSGRRTAMTRAAVVPFKSISLEAHNTSVITSLQLDPINNQFYSASDDGTVAIWSIDDCSAHSIDDNGKDDDNDNNNSEEKRQQRRRQQQRPTTPLHILKGPNTGGIWALKACPRRLFIVVGSTDRTLVVWGRAKGKEFCSQLIGHTSTVRCVDIVSDRWIVSGGRDGTVRVWDYDEIERDSLRNSSAGSSHHLLIPCLWTLSGHKASVRCLAVLERNSSAGAAAEHLTPLLVSGSYDGTLRVWEMCQVSGDGDGGDNSPKLHSVLEGHDGKVYSVATCKRFSLIVSGGLDGKIKCWLLAAGSYTLIQSLSTHNALVGIITIRGRLLCAGSTDGSVSLWRVGRDGLTLLRFIDGAHKSSITALDSNLHILASGSERSIRLWSLERMLAASSFGGFSGSGDDNNNHSVQYQHQHEDYDDDDVFITPQHVNNDSSLLLPLSLKADVVWKICLGPPLDLGGCGDCGSSCCGSGSNGSGGSGSSGSNDSSTATTATTATTNPSWMERILVVAYQENGLSKIDLFHLLPAP